MPKRKSIYRRNSPFSRRFKKESAARPRIVHGGPAKAKKRRSSSEDGSEASADGRGTLLSRRHFLYGAVGVAAVAAVGGGGYALSRAGASENADSEEVLSVPAENVFTTDECAELVDDSVPMTLVNSQTIDYGTLIWAGDDDIAACLVPTETAKPLAKIALLSLAENTCTTIIENACAQDEGFEIYDVRADAHGVLWAEANILEGTWRVYHAALDGLSLGAIVLGAQGDADWEMPTLAVVDAYAFWQVVPRTDGSSTLEDSKLYRALLGTDGAEEVYASHGCMACAPCMADGGVVITPRADVSGTYYQLTRIDAASAQATEALVLPSGMKPLEATYGESGFAFAFDAIYDYGDGIANLGTYTTAEMPTAGSGDPPDTSDATSTSALVETAAAYNGATWFRYPRSPLAAPAWCGNWFIVKSTSAVCGVNLSTREYFALDVEEGTDDYGDYLASAGTCSRIVTYSNIDYTTVDNTQVRHCLVRIWEPTA